MPRFIVLLMMLVFACSAQSADGVTTVLSAHSVCVTMDRLVAALENKGMRIVARIDHRKGAQTVGKKLRATELLIFGNPKVGTPLMQCTQTAAIDLPQKALVWQDERGQVWLAYNDPSYLKRRHGLVGCDEALEKIDRALANFAKAATAPSSDFSPGGAAHP